MKRIKEGSDSQTSQVPIIDHNRNQSLADFNKLLHMWCKRLELLISYWEKPEKSNAKVTHSDILAYTQMPVLKEKRESLLWRMYQTTSVS